MQSKRRDWKEVMTYPRKVPWVMIGVTFTAIVVGAFYFDGTSERSRQEQTKLEKEFHAIPPPEGTVGFDYFGSQKTQHALVSEKFRSTWSHQQIRDYYDAQFKNHGWQFLDEKPTSGKLADSEERSLYYRKGDHTAALEFQPKSSNSGYSYALDFSWGLH